MMICLDTNVLQALIQIPHIFNADAERLIIDARDANHRFMVCPIVYTEAFGIPGFKKEIFDLFLTGLGAEIDWLMPIETWEIAGKAQINFLTRRRKLGLEGEKRVLPDFLIGAHALARGAALMTFDENRYRTSFPKLKLITK
jgi:predicted nucleic acid-binding protein